MKNGTCKLFAANVELIFGDVLVEYYVVLTCFISNRTISKFALEFCHIYFLKNIQINIVLPALDRKNRMNVNW